MATISENLQIIKNAIDNIKQAIINKGGVINGDITTWADAIRSIGVLNYLAFTAVEDSVIRLATFDMDMGEITTDTPAVNLEYSMDGIDFQEWNYETQLHAGQTLYLRGDNPTGFSSDTIAYTFGASTGKFECHGNIMSLLYNDEFEGKLTISSTHCYQYMFYGCTSLTTAPELPATTLTDYCYYKMFGNCTSLTIAPELPATTLATDCYDGMFSGCTSLTTAPELPATTLADYCYYEMFGDCTSLATAPELRATTLTEGCYYYMFYGCTSLTTAPTLPATILTGYCYNSMFYGCTSLTTAPELPATTLANDCYYSMFSGCSSLTSVLFIELPATILTDWCYGYMFHGCTKLNRIKMLATDISAKKCLYNWLSDVSSTGTFIKDTNMTSLPIGVDGIPTGWTVFNTDEFVSDDFEQL